jgi:hypothetical protein
MTDNYKRCKKAIYTYKSKNSEKIREYNNQYCKNYYRYQKELKAFMNILLDEPEEKEPSNSALYYHENKAEILEKKKLYYQKKKLLRQQCE